MTKAWQKWITVYLVAAMFVIGITPRVYAGFSPSEGIGFSSLDRSADLQRVQKFLETKMVRERLKDLGFTAEEIQARLNQLNGPQLHQLVLKMDDLKVGADSGLGVVIALLVIAILVIIVIQLTGHRVVVK